VAQGEGRSEVGPLPASLLNIGHRAGKERTHMTNETMQELTPEQLHQTIEEYLVSEDPYQLVSSPIRDMAYEKLESDYLRHPQMAVEDYKHNLERINALIESGHFS